MASLWLEYLWPACDWSTYGQPVIGVLMASLWLEYLWPACDWSTYGQPVIGVFMASLFHVSESNQLPKGCDLAMKLTHIISNGIQCQKILGKSWLHDFLWVVDLWSCTCGVKSHSFVYRCGMRRRGHGMGRRGHGMGRKGLISIHTFPSLKYSFI